MPNQTYESALALAHKNSDVQSDEALRAAYKKAKKDRLDAGKVYTKLN